MKEMFGEREGFHAYLLAEVDYLLHTSSNKSLFPAFPEYPVEPMGKNLEVCPLYLGLQAILK